MKQTAMTLVALFLTGAATESALAQRLSVGVRGGYSSTTIHWDGVDAFGTDWRSRFHAGALASLQLQDLLSVQLELWYAQKGAGLSDPARFAEGDLRAAYVEIPLLAELTIPTGGTVTPHLLAGPAVAFEVSCRVSATLGGFSFDDRCDAPSVAIDRKKTDVSLVFGAGLAVQAGAGAFLFDVLYDLGLRNLNAAPDAPADDVRSRAFTISAGYRLPVGRK